ncbi:MAG: hypothetical protein L0H83_11835, partial [Salinisphaera sp.]|nr:hypothetical protein [Salinisphaera sp.]
MADIRRGGLFQLVRRRVLPNGDRITVRFDGTTPVVEIESEREPVEQERQFNLWLPRGFVTYPATNTARYGAGLPIIPDATADTYARINRAPGLDWARWTADGALGEMLLSRDENAGYPTIGPVAPLLWHDVYGPRPTAEEIRELHTRPPDTATYKGYRIEFQPFVQGSDQVVWELTNAQRVSAGVEPLLLWPRGHFRTGESIARIINETGIQKHHSQGFPPTYQTSYERAAKDGHPYDMSLGVNTAPPPTAPFPGEPDPYPDWFTIARYGRALVYGGSENIAWGVSDPNDAFDLWLGSPPHKANIEDDNWNGHRTMLDTAQAGTSWAQGFRRKSRWIEAGNGQFHSENPDVPALTWHTFASMSLAWETWPITYNASTGALEKLFDWTVAGSTAGDGGGGSAFTYLRTPTSDDTDADNPSDKLDAALGRHLYMRGRAIALSPRGGLILGAGVTRVADDGDEDTPLQDRFIAIVHHPEDQPGNFRDGMTRYIRIWYCDVDVRELLANPEQTICGEASDTYNTLPWLGGELVDLGIMPDAPSPALATPPGTLNSLKYSSLWKFSPDGTKAICLRDFKSADQYETGFGTVAQTTISYGGFPRGVELTFGADPTTGVLNHTLNWLPFPSGDYRTVTSVPGVAIPTGTSVEERNPVPMAAEYDALGNVMYAWYGDFVFIPSDGFPVIVRVMGTGNVSWPSDLDNLVLVSVNQGLPEIDFRTTMGSGLVLDVRSGAFVADGTRCRT